MITSLTIAVGTLFFLFPYETRNLKASLGHAGEEMRLGAFPVVEPTIRYGFALDTFEVKEGRIKSGDYLGSLLSQYGLNPVEVDQLAQSAKGVFDVRDLRQGNPYMILASEDLHSADYFIYEPSVYEYFVFHLGSPLKVEKVERPVVRKVENAGGTIETSLWDAMVESGLSYEVTDKMEDALQWSVDFHHLQKGDQFKLVYDQDYVEGKAVGVDKVHAAYYKSENKEYYAIYYNNEEHKGYYDREGRPMKKGFLKAPVRFSRISSHFNLHRFHPILKRVRPHLGTDYAAPYGTEILAVGDGTISAASYTSGNGNFVKIRHDNRIETQYLHMQRFARGIHPGVRVEQGQVIGYVGSTGLATGPHVCFRFWKNGQQVNHLNMSFPPAKPLPAEEMLKFAVVRDSMVRLLNVAP